MGANLVDQVIKRVNAVPPLPAAVQRLNEMTGNTEISYEEMADVIATDEVLTTKILRVANSSFYGLSQRVSTISQGVVVLGLQGIRSLSLGVTVFGFKAGASDACSLKRDTLWRHSLGVASAARTLASHFQLPNWEEAFVGGMLHDIGKIIFMECFPKEYAAVLQQVLTGSKPLEQLENETFGMDHTALGAELCRRWKMPASLSRMVSMHHLTPKEKAFTSEQDRMLYAVLIADNITRIAQIGSDGNPNTDSDFLNVVRVMELSSEQLLEFIQMLPTEVHKVEEFFDLPPEARTATPDKSTAAAGALLANPDDNELVRITLLALGYPLASSIEIMRGGSELAGIVVDDELAPESREILERRGVRLLDFSAWLKENACVDPSVHLDVVRLRQWLNKEMPVPASNANTL
jgi:putative nucleotidyltransferase with HDIG domain